jgi:hypothetical protein
MSDNGLDQACCCLGIVMFPNSDDSPSSLDQRPIGFEVAPHIAVEFGGPEVGVGLGSGAVDGTAVPVAAVDKHSDLGARKEDVSGARYISNRSPINEVAEAKCMQPSAESELWRRISAAVGHHARLGGG